MRMSSLIALLCAVGCFGGVNASPQNGAEPSKVTYTDVVLARLTPDDTLLEAKCSPDNRRLMVAVQRGNLPGGGEVVVDGKAIPTPDGYMLQSMAFSPDGSRYAFLIAEGGRYRMIVEGRKDPPVDAATPATFSADGKRVWYVALNGGQSEMVLDGRRLTSRFPFINDKLVLFSPDGSRLAFIGGLGPGRGGALIVDDRAIHRFEDGTKYYVPTFSPNGSRLLFPMQKPDAEIEIHEGEKRYAAGEDIVEGTPLFSPDGKRIVYGSRKGSDWRLVVDGKEGKAYRRIVSPPAFSPDGLKLACLFEDRDGKVVLEIDGREVARAQALTMPTFSKDGKRMGYVAVDGEQWRVVIDGAVVGTYQAANQIQFSDDGAVCCFNAKDHRGEFALRDGKETGIYRGFYASTLSPDGARVAVAGDTPEGVVVEVAGKKGKPFKALMALPVFSPDGRHVAYIAQKDGATHLVVDDVWSKPYVGTVKGTAITFSAPDKAHALMMPDLRTFVRVDAEVSGNDYAAGSAGEGVLGLRRTFHAAGAQRVVAALWPGAALRSAVSSLCSPDMWAALVLSGDGR
jgi:Tol biopolymer transport system component